MEITNETHHMIAVMLIGVPNATSPQLWTKWSYERPKNYNAQLPSCRTTKSAMDYRSRATARGRFQADDNSQQTRHKMTTPCLTEAGAVTGRKEKYIILLKDMQVAVACIIKILNEVMWGTFNGFLYVSREWVLRVWNRRLRVVEVKPYLKTQRIKK